MREKDREREREIIFQFLQYLGKMRSVNSSFGGCSGVVDPSNTMVIFISFPLYYFCSSFLITMFPKAKPSQLMCIIRQRCLNAMEAKRKCVIQMEKMGMDETHCIHLIHSQLNQIMLQSITNFTHNDFFFINPFYDLAFQNITNFVSDLFKL